MGLTAWRIYAGHAKVTVADHVVEAGPGDWLLPRPVPRLHEFSPDIELLSLNFFAQWPTGEPLFSDRLGITLKSSDYPKLERYAGEINRVLDRFVPRHQYQVFTEAMTLAQFLVVQRAFGRFFSAYVATLADRGIEPRPPGQTDPRLAKAVDLLQECGLDDSPDMNRLSRSAGLSAVQLNRLAVRQFGHTLRDEHELRRAEYARRCLLTPGASVKQVAHSLGFTVLSHFSRWFRKHSAVGPREFRDRGRQV